MTRIDHLLPKDHVFEFYCQCENYIDEQFVRTLVHDL